MVEVIDRKKLEYAIAAAGRWQTADYRETVNVLIAAAEAHLATLPNTKMVEVWRVEVAFKFSDGYDPRCEAHSNKVDADRSALQWRNAGHSCIRVTGPHQQEVPA